MVSIEIPETPEFTVIVCSRLPYLTPIADNEPVTSDGEALSDVSDDGYAEDVPDNDESGGNESGSDEEQFPKVKLTKTRKSVTATKAILTKTKSTATTKGRQKFTATAKSRQVKGKKSTTTNAKGKAKSKRKAVDGVEDEGVTPPRKVRSTAAQASTSSFDQMLTFNSLSECHNSTLGFE